jgi:hypothetical protein
MKKFLVSMLAVMSAFSIKMDAHAEEIGANKSNLKINASGENGDSGRDGSDADQNRPQNPPPGGGRPRDAEPGGSGREGGPGGNAGSIEIQLAERDGQLEASGNIRWPGGHQTPIQNQLPIRDIGTVYLNAVGGTGGRGGNAGRGQPGANGIHGKPAEFSPDGQSIIPPGDGQSGYPGGDAGDPGRGGRAGDGGDILLKLSSDDTHLVPLVRADTSAGKPGENGNPITSGSDRIAPGGEAGDPGANIYKKRIRFKVDGQIVHEADYELRDQGYYAEYSPAPDQPPMKQWVPARAPEARPGSRGPTGRASQIPPPSQQGRSGRYTIQVIDSGSGQVSTYSYPWNLEIKEVSLLARSGNNFVEPGEINDLRVVVKNKGEMPSPGNQKIQITLVDAQGRPQGSRSILLPSIPSGREATIDGELKFEAPQMNYRGPGDRQVLTTQAIAQGGIPSIDHPNLFRSAPVGISVTYPIEIDTLYGPGALRPGEAFKVLAKVKLVGNRNLDPAREMASRWNASGRSLPEDTLRKLVFRSPQEGGKVIDPTTSEGWVALIKSLSAGQEATVELNVGVPADIKTSGGLHLLERLELTPLGGGQRQTVQGRELETRIVSAFVPNPSSDVLLVSHKSIPIQRIQELKELIETGSGLAVDVLDLSIDSLLRLFEGGSPLAEIYRGKSIVLLTGGVDAAQMVDLTDLLRSMVSQDISILTPQGNSITEETLRETLMPVNYNPDSTPTKGKFDDSINEVIKRVKDSKPGQESRRYTFIDSYTFRNPNEEDLQKAAEKLQAALLREFPHRRFTLVKTFVGLKDTGGAWLSKNYNVGHLDIVETTDTRSGRFLSARLVDGSSTINSDLFFRGFLRTLRPEMLRKILHSTFRGAYSIQAFALEILASRVGEELRDLQSIKDPRFELKHLAEMVELSKGLESERALQPALVEMLAQVSALSSWLRNRDVSRQVSQAVETVVNRFGGSSDSIRTQVASRAQAITRSSDNVYDALRRQWSAGAHWVTDFDVLDPNERIEASIKTAERLQARQTAARKLREFADRQERARQSFLIPGGCQAILSSMASADVSSET